MELNICWMGSLRSQLSFTLLNAQIALFSLCVPGGVGRSSYLGVISRGKNCAGSHNGRLYEGVKREREREELLIHNNGVGEGYFVRVHGMFLLKHVKFHAQQAENNPRFMERFMRHELVKFCSLANVKYAGWDAQCLGFN